MSKRIDAAIKELKDALNEYPTKFEPATHNMVCRVFSKTRRTGLSTTLAGVLKINPKAVVVVGCEGMRLNFIKEHNVSSNQVFSLRNIDCALLGFEGGPILFDSTAIMEMLLTIRKEVKNG